MPDTRVNRPEPLSVSLPKPTMADQHPMWQRLRDVIEVEASALQAVAAGVSVASEHALELLKHVSGRIIVTGMGKAGLIGRKAAATFSSTGTPAFFLHPAEAIHGDLGIVQPGDLLLALSNSGETAEVISLLPYMRRFGVPVLSLTGNSASTLAQQSDVVLSTHVPREATDVTPAPTCSTTAMLAMCDALAVCLMEGRGFTQEKFAIFHPGGSLGRKMLLRVDDLMCRGDELPIVSSSMNVRAAVMIMSRKGLGCAIVLDDRLTLKGIFTDGDLRRLFEREEHPLALQVEQVMSTQPKQIDPAELAASALKLMEDHAISVVPCVDASDRCVGVIHLHQLVKAGLA